MGVDVGWLTPELAAALGSSGLVLILLTLGIIKWIRDTAPRQHADAYMGAALEDARRDIRRLRDQVAELTARVSELTAELHTATVDARRWQERAIRHGWTGSDDGD